MLNIPVKNDLDLYQPSEFNSFYGESKNTIESSGQTLNGADTFQLAKALSIYKNSQYCKDTGTANNYILKEPLTSLKSSPVYFDGMSLLFKATNTNTGVSNINYNSIGNKSIVIDNIPLTGNEIIINNYYFLIYDISNDNFELLPFIKLSSQIDSFNNTNSSALTPFLLSINPAVQNFSISGNTGTISQLLNGGVVGGSSYNMLIPMLEANESQNGYIPTFKDKNDITQTTYLDETNDKFLFPSNLYTFNNNYICYILRIIVTIDYPSISANSKTTFSIRLRRFIDNSIVSRKKIDLKDAPATTGDIYTSEFLTFVGGETDPYVVDGMYVDIINEEASDTSITLTNGNIRIFKF